MSETYSSDAVVIGAGAVGLAIARRLALRGLHTIILEKNSHFGMETSSRSSEVIHAGLYYPEGSRKAVLCARGRDQLYDFCATHGVPHRRLGKLIVAQRGQEEKLAAVAAAAAANGVDLQPLDRAGIARLEPEVRAEAGLFSPMTGIFDSHQYMLALLGDAEGAGAHLVRDAHVDVIARTADGYRLAIRNGGEELALGCRILINSGGLWAQQVASRIGGLDAAFVPPLFLAKGSYTTLSKPCPFRHLIYPLPEPGGLGVHLTLDMGGGARFGANVEWLHTDDPAQIDYAVSPELPSQYAPLIAAWWPALTPAALAPGYSGVRPKTVGPGAANADFRIDGPETHGLPGLVNLFGIESPGLTASLAIAEHVEGLLHD